ncbi:SIL1 [Pyricularia oryzae 70-15]|uniref:Nucleotide exchange factor SIL1 n=4 Tax=Pyricularia oryzae TaxID=318829 RepID=G4MYJ3_PYRO7|nr:SIL1 [Pyricularia oryzae 70-15]ABW04814.1 SIL1 [Pyricularia oryzae]ELQ33289.1 nucleotide exchange factor SIL1 precursor [Pyricularia oryzae Y34]EHA53613.1 SIL1 [Pyricularia oryzae 70-15]KAI7919411.1 nucleotide exchange factor SIL1 [Pyricularia oryzae]KAI7926884.1 nucleotide exchange factor SIL1 [Pyricularia oryzae]
MRHLTLLGLFACAGTALASGFPRVVKDDGENELICHTKNATDCYPKIFQATKEFQPVRADQDIPPGLHVRLNIQTGEKEAKLNDPNEKRPDLEGLPVDSSIVLVDPEEGVERPIPAGAPKYEPVGKVKEQIGPEAEQFHQALAVLKAGHVSNGVDFDDALDKLNELSHDMYFGSIIAQDLDILRSLLCIMSTKDAFVKDSASSSVPRALRAAGTISAALQNNPTALKAVEKHWPALMEANCSSDGERVSLGSLVFSTIQPGKEILTASGRDPGPGLVKAKLSAVNGLLKSSEIRQFFLDQNGMQEILRVLIVKDPEYNDAQVRAANLVSDTFLDESMGAIIGQWPSKAASSAAYCEVTGNAMQDVCWDYHIAKTAADTTSDSDHWSGSLLSMLRDQLKANGKGSGEKTGHDEL